MLPVNLHSKSYFFGFTASIYILHLIAKAPLYVRLLQYEKSGYKFQGSLMVYSFEYS
jgi:hypothetical protein